MSPSAFSKLNISPAQLKSLEALGYKAMTPVQEQSIPLILKGRDLVVRAKTGSGKTATFGIGLLNKINPRFFGAQALVLCPTRELADQVGAEIRRLASQMPNIKVVMLCGGKPFGAQRDSLQHGAHIVVGTPGRIHDHLTKGTLQIDQVSTLVLDEADRMLDMGFADTMQAIIAEVPKNRQTLLFSATYPDNIQKISRSIQANPAMVQVDDDVAHEEGVIEQLFFEIKKHERYPTLLALFEHYRPKTPQYFATPKSSAPKSPTF